MAKRRPKKRNYRMIAFKVYYDTDQAILDWWEGIEAGERSDAIRDVLHEFLGFQPRRKSTKVINLPELLEVRRDTLWIKDALNDMPAYLERVIQHVAANARPVAVGQTQTQPASNEPSLTDAETQRRARRMKRASW